MKNRSVAAQLFSGLVLTVVTLALVACGQDLYPVPQYNFAGRPIPPSKLLQRVMASYTANGSQGGLSILDGLRNLRGNVENTIPNFTIASYSNGSPSTIFNYPEETLGYVYSTFDGTFARISYGLESSNGTVATLTSTTTAVAATADGTRFAGALENLGELVLTGTAGTYSLNLPNVYKVAINSGNTVILAMVRNSNSLYRVVKVNASTTSPYPPAAGAIDCEPLLVPVYCVVPVPGTFDRPSDVYFSADGATAYVLNCGPECGGTTAGVTFLQEGALNINLIPTVDPLAPGAPSPASILPTGVPNPIPIPGGVTAATSDGLNLYLAGQQLQTSGTFAGKFAGNLTTLNLGTYAVSAPISISDGHHSKMLFADDNTLWIGSQQCANGKRAAMFAAQVAANTTTTQAANYNCLTAVKLGGGTPSVSIVPAVTEGATGSSNSTVTVPYPNTNQNAYYYGDLTGLCWVQGFHKMYTAYGNQIHAFYTGGAITAPNDPGIGTTPALGTEIDNTNITIQGSVLDVAYMDALTNAAD